MRVKEQRITAEQSVAFAQQEATPGSAAAVEESVALPLSEYTPPPAVEVGAATTAPFPDEAAASAIPAADRETAKPKPVYEVCKRVFDFLFSVIAGILSLLPILIFAVVIAVKDPGNPFYIQERVGQNGKPIRILKLRSMRKGADSEDQLTPALRDEYSREYKLRDDPRLIGWKKPGDGTRCFGARIRQWSIDEMPQILYNILFLRTLSLVGPRPILETELRENYTPEQQKQLLSVKPGLTGYWQAYARNNAAYADGTRQQMELWYVSHRSARLDLKILFATVTAVLKKNGL